MSTYIVRTGHDWSALADHPGVSITSTLDEAADVVALFMQSYGFSIKDGGLHDPGNNGADVFTDVAWHEGRVIAFTHCDGDGPIVKTGKA